MKRIAAMAAALAFSGTSAAMTTGNDLLASCRGVDTGFCLGYLDGVTDGHFVVWAEWDFAKNVANDPAKRSMWSAIVAPEPRRFCLPPRATLGQLRLVYIKYATDNPKGLADPAGIVARNALTDAFPCGSPSSR